MWFKKSSISSQGSQMIRLWETFLKKRHFHYPSLILWATVSYSGHGVTALYVRVTQQILAYVVTPDYASFFATSLKNLTLWAISGTELSQLCSYSIEKTPLNCWSFSSARIAGTSAIPVPHGTS